MIKEVGSLESKEIKNTEVGGIKDIKPKSEINIQERDSFWNRIFHKDVKDDDHFVSYEERLKYTPKEDSNLGEWAGERGESKFIPSSETLEGQAVRDKLAEYGLDGIEYKNAEPDFSKCSEATVKIDNMTGNRPDYYDSDGSSRHGNFKQADIKCAEKWNKEKKDGKTDWSARDVDKWRHDNGCSWHERCDTKTMDLVPREIHEKFKHSGGVAECKARDSFNIGGGFDA